MKKILFIVPPNIQYCDFINPAYNTRTVKKKFGNFGSVLTDMPLGVMSLSSYLKKHTSVKTKLIDFNVELNKLEGFDFKSFKDYFCDFLYKFKWKKNNPDIIGISSLFTPSFQNMIDIAECCRKIFPKAFIIAGGGVPTNMYKEIFELSDNFDALCFGEGEKPLLSLVKSKNMFDFVETGTSWITKRKVNEGQTFKHDFIDDLDEIPFYDYDILNVNDYALNPAITAYASVDKKKQNYHVMTSRGCANRCCFCASHTVHGRKVRYYSFERVKEDFNLLKNKYGAETFIFQDDHLMADKKRAKRIIELVKELGVTAVFQNGLALYALDRDMLETLKSAGVNQIMLSVESGSDRVLRDIMHKPLDLNIVRRVAKDCRDLDMYSNVNILIGLPGETKKDIEDARIFLRTIDANWFLIFCANPLVGSEMYEICKKKNYLKGDFIGSDYKKAVVETEDFTGDYIQEMTYILNLDLNFVNNSDMRLGNYEMALKGFENAIRAKSDHALAHYFRAKCYEKLGDIENMKQSLDVAKKIVNESQFWRKYVDMFNISM